MMDSRNAGLTALTSGSSRSASRREREPSSTSAWRSFAPLGAPDTREKPIAARSCPRGWASVSRSSPMFWVSRTASMLGSRAGSTRPHQISRPCLAQGGGGGEEQRGEQQQRRERKQAFHTALYGKGSVSMINGKKIGLCLGSGGARGLAHVGVLQVLEENGIVPDMVSGCSAGAIFGAIYAAGTDLYMLEKYLGTVEARTIIDLGIPIQGGFLSGDRIEEVVMTLTHDLSFDETRIPFVCIATDLMTGEMKAFDKGKLHRAVRASMAVPGVFTPALIDDHYYVDGGVLEELPVDVLRDRGADVVITSDLGIKRNFFDPEHPSPIDVLRRSSDIMQARLTERQADKGDVVIRPDASFMGLLKINGYEESVEAGRQKALEALPRIRELLGMNGTEPGNS